MGAVSLPIAACDVSMRRLQLAQKAYEVEVLSGAQKACLEVLFESLPRRIVTTRW